jgi:hypothetical protein
VALSTLLLRQKLVRILPAVWMQKVLVARISAEIVEI